MTDERPIIFRKELFGLVATDDASEAAMRSIKLGDCVEVKMKVPRNIRQLRLFWKLMDTVCENQTHYKTSKEVCAAFKFACGEYDILQTKRGEEKVLRSIAIPAMDQIAFNDFFKRAVDFCVTEVIPGLDSTALEAEVMEMIR